MVGIHDENHPDPQAIPAYEDETIIKNDANGASIENKDVEMIISVGNDESSGWLERMHQSCSAFLSRYGRRINQAIILILVIGLHVFLGFAIAHNFHDAIALLVLVIIGWIAFIYFYIFKPHCGDAFENNVWRPLTNWFCQDTSVAKLVRLAIVIVGLGAVIFVAIYFPLSGGNPRYLSSLGAYVLFWIVIMALSKAPHKISFRPILWGIFLQYLFGFLVLTWDSGREAFNWVADQIITFLDYTNNGTDFVYGFLADPSPALQEQYGVEPVFAFTTLQVIIYFGAVVNLLYYFGIMQWVLTLLANFVQATMGTTATESFNAVACIFLGQSEAPLMIKPYLPKMTTSEIHAVMTSGFACIAGSLFAAYIGFGACPQYILSATLMSAATSLAVSKAFWPETEVSHVRLVSDLELPPSEERNALEAVSNGAVSTIKIVEAIIANLIVFLALLALIDDATEWFVGLIGYQGVTFEVLLGYIFFPVALIMDVSDAKDWGTVKNETMIVAQLLGTKTVLNEFIAYERLSPMIMCNRLGPRAQMMATYALCSFSNFSSIGIQLGTIGAMCPERKETLSRCAFRALFAGLVTSLMSTCVAGLLVTDFEPCHTYTEEQLNQTCGNSTQTTMIYQSTTTVMTELITSAITALKK